MNDDDERKCKMLVGKLKYSANYLIEIVLFNQPIEEAIQAKSKRKIIHEKTLAEIKPTNVVNGSIFCSAIEYDYCKFTCD